MRILFVIGSLSTGGAERQLSLLARGLSHRKNVVHVATLFPGGEYEEELSSCQGVHLSSLTKRRSQGATKRLFQYCLAFWNLRRLIREIRPDCVYSMLHLSNLFAWIAVKGCHDVALVWGYRASNMKLNWKRLLPERLCGLLSPSVALVIANSHTGATYAREKRHYRPKRMCIVQNGIDVGLFQFNANGAEAFRRELGIDRSTQLIGVVGRIDPVKGHACFLNAVRYVSNRVPLSIFLIVGDGNQQTIAELQDLAVRLGVHERVHWLGNRSEMASIYSSLDVFVSSSFSEGFSNVIGEAMACGASCVVTDVGDSARIVGEFGRVVRPNDHRALGKGIVNALSTLRANSRDDRRRRIQEHYSQDTLITKTELLLEELVCGSKS